MTFLTDLALRRSSVTLLVILLVLVAGVFTYMNLQRELFPEIEFPNINIVTVAVRLATTGFRLHHRQARTARVIGRARTDSPVRKRRRSSPSSRAVWYRESGTFSKHFRQIVSTSLGTMLLSFRNPEASSKSIW